MPKDIDDDFKPFVSHGFLSLTDDVDRVPVVILRDTCAKYSIARRGILPFSDQSYCGSDLLVWGIGLSVLRVPVHSVKLSCPLVTGRVRIGVRDQLPVTGVDIILGNDLAGQKVFPTVPEVTEVPFADVCVFSPPDSPPVFPACVVTRARARKLGEATDLSDSFLCAPDNSGSPGSESKNVSVSVIVPDDDDLSLSVTREQLIEAQKSDCSLTKCMSAAQNDKCEFGKAMVTYLGKRVGQGQVRPLAAKVQAILDFPVPETRRQLRRFLGMCGYYRGFCKNFASVVAPLTTLTSPSKSFVWNELCQDSFNAAKALLCSAPVLSAPNFTRPFKVEVDASAQGAGAVLVQEDDNGVDHPVCFFSRKFDKHQVHYSTIEKETLALLWALQHFEVYVGSSSDPVKVFTDHNPLVFLSRMRNHNSRLMRWSLLMQDFNVDVHHIKGTDNIVADALSRTGV